MRFTSSRHRRQRRRAAAQIEYLDTAGIGAGINEQQTITATSTLTVATVQQRNATAIRSARHHRAISANLNTVPQLNGNISITGVNGGPWTIDFINALANRDLPQIGVNNNNANASVIRNGAGPLADQIAGVNVNVNRSGSLNFGSKIDNVGVTVVEGGQIQGTTGTFTISRGILIGGKIDSGTGTFGVTRVGNSNDVASCAIQPRPSRASRATSV
jgi:hypothetical protein